MTEKQATTQLEAMRIAGIKVPEHAERVIQDYVDHTDKRIDQLVASDEMAHKRIEVLNKNTLERTDKMLSRIESLESIRNTLADSPIDNKNEYHEKEIGSIYKELREVKEEFLLYKKIYKVFWLLCLGYLIGSFIDKFFGDE